MATLYQTAQLLKEWHFRSLNKTEKKFIDDFLSFVGDGSDNPSDEIVMADNQVTKKMADWLRNIGRRFLITKATRV